LSCRGSRCPQPFCHSSRCTGTTTTSPAIICASPTSPSSTSTAPLPRHPHPHDLVVVSCHARATIISSSSIPPHCRLLDLIFPVAPLFSSGKCHRNLTHHRLCLPQPRRSPPSCTVILAVPTPPQTHHHRPDHSRRRPPWSHRHSIAPHHPQ
jgi:hypothetical protein